MMVMMYGDNDGVDNDDDDVDGNDVDDDDDDDDFHLAIEQSFDKSVGSVESR